MMKVGSCLPRAYAAVGMQTNKRIINCECYSEKQSAKGDQEPQMSEGAKSWGHRRAGEC